MKINVLFFSSLRDLVGTENLGINLESETATLGELLDVLYLDHPVLRDWDSQLLLAINAEYATREETVRDGDEVALMPPVQGG